MLASRNGIARQHSSDVYVCLNCRLKSSQNRQQQQRKRNLHAFDGSIHPNSTAREDADSNQTSGILDGGDSTNLSCQGRRNKSLEGKDVHKKVGSRKKTRGWLNMPVLDPKMRMYPSLQPECRVRPLLRRSSAIGKSACDPMSTASQDQIGTVENVAAQRAGHFASSASPSTPHLYQQSVSSNAPQHSIRQQVGVLPLMPHWSSRNNSQLRQYNTATMNAQQAATTAAAAAAADNVFAPWGDMHTRPEASIDAAHASGIRAQFRRWQELHGHDDPMPDIMPPQDDVASDDEATNSLTRLSSEASMQLNALQNEDEDATQVLAGFTESRDGVGIDSIRHGKQLDMGDLVELEDLQSERENTLAVFVRNINTGPNMGQFFTIHGKWTHVSQKTVQYSIPAWVSPKLVKPLLEHLPDPEIEIDTTSLMDRAYMEDLSVPREVGAPLVSKMVEFHNESLEIYRKNASALDDAHKTLAHETDLRYGSLASAAAALLKIPSDKIPLTALFTVRKALSNGGFAFNFDRRSHRLTGYMQIRSKEQVKMLDKVRTWLRQWQDDLALIAAMDNVRLRRQHKAEKGARIVHGFINKARAIVLKSREDRSPTEAYNVSPSKIRHHVAHEAGCIRVHKDAQFTTEEQEIVRFLESWACSGMFHGLPRLQSLPPLVLQATGLYEDYALSVGTGFMFLQELGTIMPYDNRVKFDPHLLLPSSQHSKPLQNLMTTIVGMQNEPDFSDSMAHLRHDWGDMPVYCIDAADAQEIDDGISVEPAGTGPDGEEQHWVHVHIANPTAFFRRDHPLAKMARHMGETIYMPDRNYVMLPHWATKAHFSLGNNRPCLTFSTKLDVHGRTLERKITPGMVRNVVRLTREETAQVLGVMDEGNYPERIFTVGGEAPRERFRKSPLKAMTDVHKIQLTTLLTLAGRRTEIREQAGGVFFSTTQPDVRVWSNAMSPGLGWDHPHRMGSRTVEGDPIIQVRSVEMSNPFTQSTSAVDVLVREIMLLACETGASWCAEREIPVIYRGTLPKNDGRDPNEYWNKVIVPAMRDTGKVPMRLGLEYIHMIGSTILVTKPKRQVYLGIENYSKVTSPLRRYGDMVVHWQIEAALRYEAETGKSLVVAADKRQKFPSSPERAFLPFSLPVLENIMLGLHPRESAIQRAKDTALSHWVTMMIFRKHYFQEDGGLPFGNGEDGRPALRVFVHAERGRIAECTPVVDCTSIEFNRCFTMDRPHLHGLSEEVKQGDVWEVEIYKVNCYSRRVMVKPLRLVGREGAGIL